MITAQTICPFLRPSPSWRTARSLLRLKMSYSGPPQKFFLPFLPSLFRFVTLSAVAWGTAKARSEAAAADGFGRTEEQMQSPSSRRRSGPAAATASERAGKPDRRRKGKDGEILFCTYYESDGGRSVCVRVCEQGGGSTRIRALDSRLDLGFNETVRVKPIRCEVA